MPDNPTNAPAAGWYPDPSNPGQERWWGGVEWTNDVRPLPAPSPAQSPALAAVPGGGVNPFASADAQEARATSSMFGDSLAAPASTSSMFSSLDSGTVTTPQGLFGATEPQGLFGTAPAQNSLGSTASWYDTSRRDDSRPDPTNGQATAGLVLSLVGLNVFGIVFSILGLRKARGFEDDGDLPVGRKRSRWGLGLGIASVILSLAVTAAYLFAFQYFYDLYLQQTGTSVVQTDDTGFDPDAGDPAVGVIDDGTYVRADYEEAIRTEYADDGLPAPDTITCPDSGSTAEGGVIVCEIVTGDLVETRTAEYLAGGGYSITTSSMSGG